MKRKIWVLGVVGILWSGTLGALPFSLGGEFRARAGFLVTDFNSGLQFEQNNITGTKLNLSNDLDVDRNTVVPFVEFWFGGKFALNLAYMDSKFEGDVTTNSRITYNGVVLTDGLSSKKVTTDIDFRTLDIAVQWSPIYQKRVQIGGILGGKYFFYKGRLANETDSIVVTGQEEVLIPYIGGEVRIRPIPLVSFHARLRGITFKWTDVDIVRGQYLEVEVGATLHFAKYFGITLEYRYVEVRATRGNSGDLDRFATFIDGVVFSLFLQL